MIEDEHQPYNKSSKGLIQRVVELWTIAAEDLLQAQDVGLIPWVPLTDFADPPETMMQRCREAIEQHAPAYESVLLGPFDILYGPTNQKAAAQGIPKFTDLQVDFSRDGFHWDRSHRASAGRGGPVSATVTGWFRAGFFSCCTLDFLDSLY